MRWAVHCRVIDNYGDVGVAWRLCADLATRGERVRLVIDDARALSWLAADRRGLVAVAPWDAAAAEVPEVAVETFGCGFPAGAVQGWAAAAGRPLCVNVEHLTAEPFAERSHGLAAPASPTSGRPWPLWFFYPGFSERSGGLLREQALADRRAASLLVEPAVVPVGDAMPRRVLAFGYANPRLAELLDAWADRPVVVDCLDAPSQADAAAWRAGRDRPPTLAVVDVPFVSQSGFDGLLWRSDLNLVRGEDSLVRAIWAERPFLWQIYPQRDGAHAAKLEAFLDVFVTGAEASLGDALRQAFRAWNGLGPRPLALPPLPAWRAHCTAFADGLASQADLTSRLIEFVHARR